MSDYAKTGVLRRYQFLILIALVLLAGVAYCVVDCWRDPWSALYNTEQELDLYSGRARFTRHRLYLQTSQEISDTPVSKALAGRDANAGREKWVMVNLFGFGRRVSPHFAYHGALVDIKTLAKVWELYNFDADARAKTAGQLLRIYREGDSYLARHEFFKWLHEWRADRKPGRPTVAKDIPDDLADRCLASAAASQPAATSMPN